MSRIEVTHGVAAGNLAAAAVTDVTGGAWVGLMEGALRSGARAASEVLARACP
jgi:monoamine oxidase